jgi:hypothetical protein
MNNSLEKVCRRLLAPNQTAFVKGKYESASRSLMDFGD